MCYRTKSLVYTEIFVSSKNELHIDTGFHFAVQCSDAASAMVKQLKMRKRSRFICISNEINNEFGDLRPY